MLNLLLSLAITLQSSAGDAGIPPLPNSVGLGGPIVGVHEQTLIVGGGANFPTPLLEGGEKVWHAQMWAMRPEGNQWREVQPLPQPLAYAACASSAHGIAVVGGSDADRVYADAFLIRWDASKQDLSYQQLPSLPQASAFGSAQIIGDVCYVLAGKSAKDDASQSGAFWSLNLANPSAGWNKLAAYPGQPQFKMATAVQQDRNGDSCLFMFSGSNADYRAIQDAYCYSPTTNKWQLLSTPPQALNAATAIGSSDGRIYVYSGSTDADLFADGKMLPLNQRPDFTTRIHVYDPRSDEWSVAGDLQTGVVTTTAVHWRDSVIIPSGETRPGIRTAAVQVHTPEVQAPPLNTGNVATAGASYFGALDKVVLFLYLAVMIAVGVYFSKKGKTTEDFFLAGRKIPWWAAGISIFGTQLSAITFMAIPATAYGSDWRRFVGSLMMMPVFLLVIYAFLPLFRRLNITTAYEYLEQRFSLSIRLFSAALFILFQIGRMGIVLLLPAIALSAVTGMTTQSCILMMGVLATAYTVLGGISAVIWTDVLQVIVLIGGAIGCLILAVNGAGGWESTWNIAMQDNKLHMFDWSWDPTQMVGWVLIIGFFFTNLVPYTTDQTVIQRYLTTPDEKQAARSMWLNMAITLPTGVLFFGLGTALYAYYQTHAGQMANLPAKEDQLVPWFVVNTLPDGLSGLVIAGIFAAAMSSLDSSINSITTSLVNDFVVRLRPNETPRNLQAPTDDLKLARKLTFVLGFIGTITALLLAKYEIQYLFDFFQKLIGLFGGALSGVFILAVFFPRCKAGGAMVGLLLGSSLTIWAAFFTSIHFLLYAVIGSLTCVAVGMLSSLLHPTQTDSMPPNGIQSD